MNMINHLKGGCYIMVGFGVITNLWALAAIIKKNTDRLGRRPVFILLFSLTLANMMFNALMPLHTDLFKGLYKWRLEYKLCKIFNLLGYITRFLPVYINVILAFERYSIVCCPFKYKINAPRFTHLIFAVSTIQDKS